VSVTDVDIGGDEIRAQLLAPSQAPGPLNPRTVAVLPLINHSTVPEQDYLFEGITDGIIFTLSLIPGLNVIGRTSMFHFKGQDARHVGARLRAGTTVDGTSANLVTGSKSS
jgi:TolB-like protein